MHPKIPDEDRGEIILSKIDLSESVLDKRQTERISATIAANADIFSVDDFDIGRCNMYKHSIDTGLARPIRQAPYRLVHALRDQLRLELDEMLEHGLISPSNSPVGFTYSLCC